MTPVRKRHHEEVFGHELLGLVRSFKRKPTHGTHDETAAAIGTNNSIEGTADEPVESKDEGAVFTAVRRCLLEWRSSVQCVGLLKGDTKAANTVLNSDYEAKTAHDKNTIPAVDAQHVLTSVLRILEGSTTKEEEALVPLAAGLIEAICEYTKTFPSPEDVCYQAEVALISKASKPILTALLSHVEVFHDSVVRAATAVMTLLGPKLSRSVDLINRWHDVVLQKHNVKTGAVFLSALPLIGGKQIKAADLYSRTVEEYLSAVRLWIDNVASIDLSSSKTNAADSKASISPDPKQNELRVLDVCKVVKEEWLAEIRSTRHEHDKVQLFTVRLRFLLAVLTALLRRDTIGTAAAAVPIAHQMLSPRAMIDLRLLEDLILNFGAASIHLLSRTKKRLRSLTASNGALSITSTAEVSEAVQLAGHDLLRAYLSTIGSSGLLPFAKRIERLSAEALWQSTPSTIRQAIEPLLNISGRMDSSIMLRASAIRTYRETVTCFGAPPISRRDDSSKKNRAVTVLCTSVIALYSTPPQRTISQSEMVDLLVLTLHTLKACIDCCGSNLAVSSRKLADSVAYTCLKAIHGNSAHPLIRHWKVRLAILRLSCSSLCAPYQDGSVACYEFRRSLRQAAQTSQYDQVDFIVLEAIAVLRVCQALDCPRRPSLFIVIKSDSDQADQRSQLAGPVETMGEKLAGIQALQEGRELDDTEQEVKEKKSTSHNDKAETKPISMSFLADTQNEGMHGAHVVLPREPIVDSLKPSTVKENDDFALFDDHMPAIVDCGPDIEDME
jgi:hypothetical protein